MEQPIREIGSRINNMDMGRKHGLTVQDTKESIIWGKSTGKESFTGQMRVSMKGSSITITFMEKECIRGRMEESMMVSGKIIRWMDMAFSRGRIEEDMKVTMWMIRSMVLESLSGLMRESIREIGSMGSNME